MPENPYQPPPTSAQDPFQTPQQPHPPPGAGYTYDKWHRGKMVLTWGIVSLAVCGVLGIVAWIMGSRDLKEMDAGIMDPAGRGATKAGMIMGIFGTTLMLLFQVLYLWAEFSQLSSSF